MGKALPQFLNASLLRLAHGCGRCGALLVALGLASGACASTRGATESPANMLDEQGDDTRGQPTAARADASSPRPTPSSEPGPRVEGRLVLNPCLRADWAYRLASVGAQVKSQTGRTGIDIALVIVEGTQAALERAKLLPFVVRMLAPGESMDLPPRPDWANKMGGVDVFCSQEPGDPTQVKLFMKIVGALTPEKRAMLESLGMKIWSPAFNGKDTITTGEAPRSSLIGLAKVDFVLRIEASQKLHMVE